MSTSNQTAGPSAGPSTDNFTAIFNVALNEYEKLTGKRLDTHPFAAKLESCQNPEAVSDVLRTQAQAFNKFREGDEKLMAWLNPTIHILSTFSDTLGGGISLVSNLVHSYMTVLGRPVPRRSHPRKRSLLGSVFFLEYVLSLVPYHNFA
jgi:fungal STAND N-terminal Goodbye domain